MAKRNGGNGKGKRARAIIGDIYAAQMERYIEIQTRIAVAKIHADAAEKYGRLNDRACEALPMARTSLNGHSCVHNRQRQLARKAIKIAEAARK